LLDWTPPEYSNIDVKKNSASTHFIVQSTSLPALTGYSADGTRKPKFGVIFYCGVLKNTYFCWTELRRPNLRPGQPAGSLEKRLIPSLSFKMAAPAFENRRLYIDLAARGDIFRRGGIN